MQTAENVRSDYDTYLVASVKYLSILYSKKKVQCLVFVILAKDIYIYQRYIYIKDIYIYI